jgi:hypothetical protein
MVESFLCFDKQFAPFIGVRARDRFGMETIGRNIVPERIGKP